MRRPAAPGGAAAAFDHRPNTPTRPPIASHRPLERGVIQLALSTITIERTILNTLLILEPVHRKQKLTQRCHSTDSHLPPLSHTHLRNLAAMRSSYLSTASATLICALALQGSASARPSSAAEEAGSVSYDALGNMVWEQAAAARQSLPDLQAPDFSSLKLKAQHALADVGSKAKSAWETDAHRLLGDIQRAASKHVKGFGAVFDKAEADLHKLQDKAGSWASRGKTFVDGIEYEKLVHPLFPDYALRITVNKQASASSTSSSSSSSAADVSKLGKTGGTAFCEDKVYQVSGYLDISSTKHLFFTFFESRSNPKKDPLVLWLNGGPAARRLVPASSSSLVRA